jgi:hypothetical protein
VDLIFAFCGISAHVTATTKSSDKELALSASWYSVLRVLQNLYCSRVVRYEIHIAMLPKLKAIPLAPVPIIDLWRTDGAEIGLLPSIHSTLFLSLAQSRPQFISPLSDPSSSSPDVFSISFLSLSLSLSPSGIKWVALSFFFVSANTFLRKKTNI